MMVEVYVLTSKRKFIKFHQVAAGFHGRENLVVTTSGQIAFFSCSCRLSSLGICLGILTSLVMCLLF